MAKEDKEEAEAEGKASGGSMKLIVIILVVLLLVVIGVGVALFMMMGDKKPAVSETGEPVAEVVETPKIPIYVPLRPAFLVNFEDQSSASHLQVDVQIMTYDENVQAALDTHMPKIRNDLLFLFGSQKYDELNTIKGKRALSKEAAKVVEATLKEAGEAHKIEAFLFTSFVMQ
jgi:flagellar protein FliL